MPYEWPAKAAAAAGLAGPSSSSSPSSFVSRLLSNRALCHLKLLSAGGGTAAAQHAAQAEADRHAAAEASLAAEKAAEAERARLAAELAEATAGDAKSYPARRRELLRDAEALLSSLPDDLGPEQLRDRAAVEQLIDALNTPVGFR